MAKGKPTKGYRRSKSHISEIRWHLREIDKLIRKMYWRIYKR